MSEEYGEPRTRLNGRVLLPSVLAVALFVVFAGLIAAVVIGITADPSAVPEHAAATPEEMATDEDADPGDAGNVGPAAAEPTAMAPDPSEHGASPPAVPSPTTAAPDASAQAGEPAPLPPVTLPPVTQATAPEPDVAPGTVAETVTAAEVPVETPAEPVVVPAPEPDKPPQVAAVPPARQLPQLAPTGRGLRPAPDPALIEQSSFGPLPRISENGREPWQAYARPSDSRTDRPRVAIIISGLGLSSAATEAAIQGLPGEVTLAFQPFADNIQQWIRLARAAGHEVLLNLPMEPVDFPANDPGPRALFVTLSPDENEERLRWALSRVTGYVGVVNHMGSRFTTSRESMKPILAEIKARGLLYVDARSSARSVATIMASEMQVPRAINDRFLDAREVSRVTIDARLTEIERIAKDAGVSIAIGQGFPVTIERVREWAQTLSSKGLTLVPVSAVVNTQADR